MYIVYIFLFAAVSAIPNSRNDVVFPKVETSRSGVKTIKFRALGQDVELNLEPAGQILGEKFGFVDENRQIYHPVNVKNLRSKLYRNSAKGAALLIDEDEPLTIEGVVNEKLRIAPHESGRMDEEGRIAHQIVEEINEEKLPLHYDMLQMDTGRELEREVESIKSMARDDQCIVIEFLSVTDQLVTKRFETVEALTEHMTLTYLGVQNILDMLELGIKVRLIGIEAYTNETEPSFIEDSAIPGHEKYLHYVKLIRNLENYYCKRNEGLAKDADIIMLTTDRPLASTPSEGKLNTNIGGAANYAAVCSQCSKVGVGVYYSYSYARVETIAHEAAHLIGIPHDGEGGVYGIPGAKNCSSKYGYFMGKSGKNHTKFSECSKACAEYLLSLPKADCLYEDCEVEWIEYFK
uniref:Metalloserrulase 6 n=1 Tax=Tityus serrulatus TaxID=6887 RepID=A0A076L882_TITSE|nr:metalloserrulase 6 [Tityus serrulatus]